MMKRYIVIVIVVALCILGSGYYYGTRQYKAGYDKGYVAGVESVHNVPDKKEADTVQTVATVQTEAKTVVRPKTQPTEPSVAVKVEKPTITATVNGKKYDFKPQSEVLDTTVKTTGVISVRVPERRWVAGIGYGKDKKVSYMLKAPIGKSAVGVWIAGSGKSNVMGGLSVSF